MSEPEDGQGPDAQAVLDLYCRGLFLMGEPGDDRRLSWHRPKARGVLPLDENFHVSRKLRRKILRGAFRITSDVAFDRILEMCAQTHDNRPETWITTPMKQIYRALHDSGHAHSIEVWDGATLVGGLFGVHLGGAFFGETMVSRAPDASKIALVHLVLTLRRNGFLLLDTQYLTPHLAQFGGMTVSATQYEARLEIALQVDAQWCCDVGLDTIGPALKILPADLLGPQ